MREESAELPDEFFEVYVVDAAMRPIGAVRVSSLIRARRETPLREIMRSPLILIRPEMDQEDVAQAFQKYHMATVSVVNPVVSVTLGALVLQERLDDSHVVVAVSGLALALIGAVVIASASDQGPRSAAPAAA
jgi:magnesium transporter